MENKSSLISVAYFRFLRGRAFGISGKTALITISIPRLVESRVIDVVHVMEKLIGVFFPVDEGRDVDIMDLVKGVIIESSMKIQREARLPIFDEWSKTDALVKTPHGVENIFAIPLVGRESFQISFDWAVEVATKVFEVENFDESLLNSFQISKKIVLDKLAKLTLRDTNSIHFRRAAHGIGLEMNEMPLGIISLGSGVHMRWLQSSCSDRTPQLATKLAASKSATRAMLRSAGLPTPMHHFVRDSDEAVRYARELGFPVVVKPDDQEQGRGVSAGLSTDEQVRQAFKEAVKFGGKILVERHYHGQDVRLTVANGEVVKVFAREAGGVVGDGEKSVAELITIENSSLRARRLCLQYGRFLLDLDQEATSLLSENGWHSGSIPKFGEFVRLRRKNNVSAGGSQIFINQSNIHDDNIKLAVRAAQALRLDIAGIDLIIPDISKSWIDSESAIIEVNSKPQIGISLMPEAYEKILRGLVGPVGNIPIHLLLYSHKDAPLLIEKINSLRMRFKIQSIFGFNNIVIGGNSFPSLFDSAFDACVGAIQNERVESLLCVMSIDDVLISGLPAAFFDSCTVHAPRKFRESQKFNFMLAMVRPHVRKWLSYLDGGN